MSAFQHKFDHGNLFVMIDVSWMQYELGSRVMII